MSCSHENFWVNVDVARLQDSGHRDNCPLVGARKREWEKHHATKGGTPNG